LNAAENSAWLKCKNILLTPHPGQRSPVIALKGHFNSNPISFISA
jgi:hypothetical protein